MFGFKLTQKSSNLLVLRLARHCRIAVVVVFGLLGWLLLNGQVIAGCGCPHQDGWYERGGDGMGRVLDEKAGRLVQTRLVYVEGNLLFAYVSSAPRCSGPECRQHMPLSNLPFVPIVLTTDLVKSINSTLSVNLQTILLLVDSLAVEDDQNVVSYSQGIERPPRLS
jgi:hypothetical protein